MNSIVKIDKMATSSSLSIKNPNPNTLISKIIKNNFFIIFNLKKLIIFFFFFFF